jgi:hypothetical protein
VTLGRLVDAGGTTGSLPESNRVNGDLCAEAPQSPAAAAAGCHRKPEKKGTVMPFINVKLIEGVFTPAHEEEITRSLTDAMVAIEGENMRS